MGLDVGEPTRFPHVPSPPSSHGGIDLGLRANESPFGRDALLRPV
jgi:hypothetical protein